MYETLRFNEQDGVATITLDRPGGNRISMQMVREISSICDYLEDDSKARVVVFRGAGGAFCAGIDFDDFDPNAAMDIHGFNKWEKCCTRIERLPMSTIALVDGPAVGGGLQLALVCDQRLATAAGMFQAPEVKLGFLPGMATFRLAKYVGLGTAKRLLLTCPQISAEQALGYGMIDTVAEDLDVGLQQAIRNLGPNHNVAVQLTRRLLNECYGTSYENALGHFLAAQHRAISQTAFLDTLKQEKKSK